jgi:uncharacterized Zn finger protein
MAPARRTSFSRRAGGGPWYEPSLPRPVEGGLVTSKQRGAMAATWWSQRFVAVLESYGLGARMQRGRRYARQGQVITLDVEAGLLTAQVQGSRATPYRVEIAWPALGSAVWAVVASAFGARAGLAARLLAGEVPPDLEAVFEAAGVPLFPRRWAHLRAHCSCPDWENPCKHLAAVLYVFADLLDDDPWLLLAWRGRDRDAVLAGLRARHGPVKGQVADTDGLPAWWPLQTGAAAPAGAGADAALAELDFARPDPPDAVLQRLARLTVLLGATPVVELLSPAYEAFVAPADAEGRRASD